MPDQDPKSFLPLKPEVFQVVLCLLEGTSHGYAIMQRVEERTNGEMKILPGALYRHLERLLEADLISELTLEEAGNIDARRRSYALTDFGRLVAEAETRRVAQLVRTAQALGLATEEP